MDSRSPDCMCRVRDSRFGGGILARSGERSEIPAQRSTSVKLNLNVAAIFCLAASIVTPAFAQNAGAGTYKAKCLMCHGADGLGATPAGKKLNAASVKQGKNKMPAYAGKLTDAQITATVAYIRTLQK